MTTTTLRRLASSAVLMLATSLVCGCTTHPAGPIDSQDLAAAQSFRLFTVYWVGRSFGGIPLTAADTQRDYDAAVGERVYYGNCDKPKSIVSTAGCQLPLEIATVDYRTIDSRENIGLGTRTDTAIRGVPAVIFDAGKSIQIYTAELAIDIYADTAARALAAAAAVVPMNRPGDAHPDVLKPPMFDANVDPQLLAIERELGVAAQAAAAARRAAGVPGVPGGTGGATGATGAAGGSGGATGGAGAADGAVSTQRPSKTS
jgi:hypothetical protein